MSSVLPVADPVAEQQPDPPLIAVEGLEVDFPGRRGLASAVRGVSFAVGRGEKVGLVGESGSGKTVTCQALIGHIDPPGVVVGGEVRWKGVPLLSAHTDGSSARAVRGRQISFVPQEPTSSLDPLYTIGAQVAEVLRSNGGMAKRAAWARAVEVLDLVGIPSPASRAKQYPHELSGGMCQRVAIAMAVATEPELVIADEPTTALDVTVQAEILELFEDLQAQMHLSVLLVSHDLGVISEFCDRVVVMYGGKVLEEAPAEDLFREPASPYTAGLLNAVPDLVGDGGRLVAIPGSPPDPRHVPAGCPFRPRCRRADERCTSMPPSVQIGPRRSVACFAPLVEEVGP